MEFNQFSQETDFGSTFVGSPVLFPGNGTASRYLENRPAYNLRISLPRSVGQDLRWKNEKQSGTLDKPLVGGIVPYFPRFNKVKGGKRTISGYRSDVCRSIEFEHTICITWNGSPLRFAKYG